MDQTKSKVQSCFMTLNLAITQILRLGNGFNCCQQYEYLFEIVSFINYKSPKSKSYATLPWWFETSHVLQRYFYHKECISTFIDIYMIIIAIVIISHLIQQQARCKVQCWESKNLPIDFKILHLVTKDMSCNLMQCNVKSCTRSSKTCHVMT